MPELSGERGKEAANLALELHLLGCSATYSKKNFGQPVTRFVKSWDDVSEPIARRAVERLCQLRDFSNTGLASGDDKTRTCSVIDGENLPENAVIRKSAVTSVLPLTWNCFHRNCYTAGSHMSLPLYHTWD